MVGQINMCERHGAMWNDVQARVREAKHYAEFVQAGDAVPAVKQ